MLNLFQNMLWECHPRSNTFLWNFDPKSIFSYDLITIMSADRIVVIDDGRIIEQGQHEELIAKRGMYYALYQTGFGQ